MIDRVMRELESRFSSLELVREMHNYLHVYLDRKEVMEAILNARTLLGFRTLQLISVVDRIEEGNFQLTWILENYTDSLVLLLSADYSRENCSVPSLSTVWPTAEAFERELYEMYGVSFPGNPREGEDFILEGWNEIPPMRRDFDTEEYSMRVFGERQPRKHIDPRQYVGEIVGEWDTPLGRRGEEE